MASLYKDMMNVVSVSEGIRIRKMRWGWRVHAGLYDNDFLKYYLILVRAE